jgi:hypothetical protein
MQPITSELTKISKRDFTEWAVKNGLSHIDSVWKASLEEVIESIDKHIAKCVEVPPKNKCIAIYNGIVRIKPNGNESYLDTTGKECTIYTYKGYFLVHTVYRTNPWDDPTSNTVVYK